MNPILAAFIQGLGYITPLQDHTPSLACEIIVEAAGGSMEVSVRGQEPPQCGSHGVAQALMTAGGDLPSKRKSERRIQRFRDGIDELRHVREVLCLSIEGLLCTHSRRSRGPPWNQDTGYMVTREGKSAPWY